MRIAEYRPPRGRLRYDGKFGGMFARPTDRTQVSEYAVLHPYSDMPPGDTRRSATVNSPLLDYRANPSI